MRRGALLVIALSVFLVACGRGAGTPEGGSDGGSLLPKDPFALPEMDVATFRALLSELRGTPVVVNVWATWCPPCVEEAPHLAEVSEEFEGRVQFIGLDILDDRPAARDFIREYGWQYPSVFDPGGQIRDALGYVGQPVTVIYDREGNLSFEHVGAVNGEMLRREIREVL
ncbi:MAG: TlpA family protein disulfide reductase [Actinomycetota bacterium]